MECMCALRYLSVLKGEMCGLGGLYNLANDRGPRIIRIRGRRLLLYSVYCLKLRIPFSSLNEDVG